MKTATTLLIAGAAIGFASPAMAQDANLPFTGPRVGVEVGYDHLRSGSTEDVDTTRDIKQSIDGVAYSGVIGYDAAVAPDVRLGVEASLGDSSARRDYNNDQPTVFNLGRVSAEREYYVGGRLGYVTSPNMMIYVKGGYTNQRYDYEGTDGTIDLRQKLDTDGYRIGAGVEYALTPNTYLGAEYRYSNYSKGELDFAGNTPDSSRFNVDTDRHQVMVTAGYRF